MGEQSGTWYVSYARVSTCLNCVQGLSSFADNPEGVEAHLAPLLSHARDQVPPSLQPETPLFLLATAGMRLLPPQKQADILRTACHFLKLHSHFRIDPPSNNGPCGSSVRIITGEEEGLFGWIAVNYLMDGFTGSSSDRTTYGFLDMGGASTQIAFEPKPSDQSLANKLIDVRLRLLGGDEIHHRVFVTTWLGYGTNRARERYVRRAIEEYEKTRPAGAPHGSSTDGEVILDPCLPKDLERKELPIQSQGSDSHSSKAHVLRGTGSFEQCLRKTSPLLNKDVPCPDAHCLFNGVHVPPIDFSVSHFIGVSEYWYSSEHIFGLGGPYDFVQYERAASEFCSENWPTLVKQHETLRKAGRVGGDGEVMKEGAVVDTGKWGTDVEISRLEMQCFKAAWIVNVLHEGIGMPTIVHPGGNSTANGDDVAKQADRKGLGKSKPTFQSVESVGDIAISWTLGKMVLEASKEVAPRNKTARPLGDPLDDVPQTPDAPVKPIRPFFDLGLIDDQLSQHLPSSLSRESLGFSPVLVLIYAILLLSLATVTYRVRPYFTLWLRRLVRGPHKRDRDLLEENYRAEEGMGGINTIDLSASSSSKWLYPLRRVLAPSSGPRPPPLNLSGNKSGRYPNEKHSSPVRSFSLPNNNQSNGFHSMSSASSSQYVSRSPSPSPGPHDDASLSNSLSSLSSRSRNSSQHNLTTLVPRRQYDQT